MKYSAVIFDLDGTLLDTIEDLADSMNLVLQKHGFPPHDVESYKIFVGDGLRNLVLKAIPDNIVDEAIIESCVASMSKEYGSRWNVKTRPYDGIPELLNTLESMGIKTAILSNKPHSITEMVVAELLPQWSFEVVYGERPSVPRKPDPAAALEISSILGVSSESCLYLGDSGIDMETANAAGMYAVGVLWGFRKADELLAAGAKKLIGKPAELLEFF